MEYIRCSGALRRPGTTATTVGIFQVVAVGGQGASVEVSVASGVRDAGRRGRMIGGVLLKVGLIVQTCQNSSGFTCSRDWKTEGNSYPFAAFSRPFK